MHANVADTGESIPRCSYHVVLSDPCAQKWPILMLPCRERGPVGAVALHISGCVSTLF